MESRVLEKVGLMKIKTRPEAYLLAVLPNGGALVAGTRVNHYLPVKCYNLSEWTEELNNKTPGAFGYVAEKNKNTCIKIDED